jgi:hypothetical protein
MQLIDPLISLTIYLNCSHGAQTPAAPGRILRRGLFGQVDVLCGGGAGMWLTISRVCLYLCVYTHVLIYIHTTQIYTNNTQLLLGGSWSTAVPAICGLIAGLLYRSNALALQRFQLPQPLCRIFGVRAMPLIWGGVDIDGWSWVLICSHLASSPPLFTCMHSCSAPC